jgi:hypothetical protein
MATYCKHGEYRDRCRECQSNRFVFDFRYCRSYPESREAIAARVSDDLLVLMGFLFHDHANARGVDEERRIMAIMACLEAARDIAEIEAGLALPRRRALGVQG